MLGPKKKSGVDLTPNALSTIYHCYFELKSDIAGEKTPDILLNPPTRFFLITVAICKILNFKIRQSLLEHPVYT